MKTPIPLLLLGLVLALTACRTRTADRDTGPADWRAWRAERQESIAGTNGWITLVGRHWLAEGNTSAGSNPSNPIILPAGRAPGRVGTFLRNGPVVRFAAAPGVGATIDGRPVTDADAVELRSDAAGKPSRLRVGELVLTIIQRGEKVGVRVRDPESPARRQFRGLPCFPYDPAWRIAGRFERFPEARVLVVDDVTGNTQSLPSPGELVFTAAGHEQRLQVVQEPDDERYFVIFRDDTAGETTYGAGRFLYVDRADTAGRVVIDFNRAFTPPCGFTDFATCPLPPRGNRLSIPIPAGERAPAGH